MGNSIITLAARKKLAAARKGEISLPIIVGIALGNGAEMDGVVKMPSSEDTCLNNELIRKPYSICTQLTETSYRYRIDLATDELAGEIINEAALYDSDGDLLAIQTFIGKPKDSDMEMGIEFDDRF